MCLCVYENTHTRTHTHLALWFVLILQQSDRPPSTEGLWMHNEAPNSPNWFLIFPPDLLLLFHAHSQLELKHRERERHEGEEHPFIHPSILPQNFQFKNLRNWMEKQKTHNHTIITIWWKHEIFSFFLMLNCNHWCSEREYKIQKPDYEKLHFWFSNVFSYVLLHANPNKSN